MKRVKKAINEIILSVRLAVQCKYVELILEFRLKMGLEVKFGNSKQIGRMYSHESRSSY